MRFMKALVALAAAALLAAAPTPIASANTYTVEDCTPTTSPSRNLIIFNDPSTEVLPCGNGAGGALRFSTTPGGPRPTQAAWKINAPEGTVIDRVQVERSFSFQGNIPGLEWSVLGAQRLE